MPVNKIIKINIQNQGEFVIEEIPVLVVEAIVDAVLVTVLVAVVATEGIVSDTIVGTTPEGTVVDTLGTDISGATEGIEAVVVIVGCGVSELNKLNGELDAVVLIV